MNKRSYKVTFLGDSATGKSSIVYRLIYDKFTGTKDSTIGATFLTKKINDISFNIWDTAGQERYLSLTTMYYRNTDIIVLVFDVSKLETTKRLKYYIERILSDVTTPYKIIIIGNKSDLIEENQMEKVNQKIQDIVNEYEIKNVDYLVISTKTGHEFDVFVNTLVSYATAIEKQNTTNNKQTQIVTVENKPPDTASYYNYYGSWCSII